MKPIALINKGLLWVCLVGMNIWGQALHAQDWERARSDAFDPTQSALLGAAEPAQAQKKVDASADGRLTLRSYLSGDNSETYDTPLISMTFLETDFHARGLTSLQLKLDLDATFILDIAKANERRFGETERLDQVRKISVSIPAGAFSIALGRHLISTAGNAWVDGLDLKLEFDQRRAEVGVYGGLSPDRFDRSLTLDYQALGLYAGVHRNTLDLSGAYNLILNEGTLDRHFLHQRTHWQVIDGLFLSSYLILDLINGPEATTFLSTLDYTPIRPLNFSLSFTQYSLEQYRNQAIYRNVIEPNQALILGDEVINLTYQRLRFSASYRFIEQWRTYLSAELKSRGQDGRRAQVYISGVTCDDLLSSGVEVDARFQFARQFMTSNLIFALSLRRELTSHLSVDARFTTFNGETLDDGGERAQIFAEAQTIYLLGLSLNGRIGGAHYLALIYDGVFEDQVADFKSDEGIFIHTLSAVYSYRY